VFEFGFLTIDMLKNPVGLVIAVCLLTQFTKELVDRIKKIPTKYIVYLYAEVLMFAMLFLTQDISRFGWREWLAEVIVVILNGIIVAMAGMKSYEEVVDYIFNKQVVKISNRVKQLKKQ